MTDVAAPPQQAESTGLLLGIGGLIFAGVALAWLFVYQPWKSDSDSQSFSEPVASAPAEPEAEAAAPEAAVAEGPRAELDVGFDNPLRMAQLAFDAGLLVEPENYSAWSLFLKARNEDPGNAQAQAGLEQVAEVLVERAGTALDQGRTADAQRLVGLVLEALPDHPNAVLLQDELPSPVIRTTEEIRPTVVETRPVITEAPQIAKVEAPPPRARQEAPTPEPSVDTFALTGEQFNAALNANQLLAPAGANARDYLRMMIELGPEREETTTARSELFAQLIRRADVAVDGMDSTAAETWLREAEALDVDGARVESVRERLVSRLVEVEAAQPIPVSELIVENYSPPRYPRRAVDRGIEGWVDLEFTVAQSGGTEDIIVLDASHDRYFREEAVAAVEDWRFEARQIRGRTVDQRVFTRLSFKLE